MMRPRGFTLLEILVALAISGFGIAVGAQMAQTSVRASRRGSETTALGGRSRLLARQLRTDLRLAGLGSTGAIGVDAAEAPWSAMAIRVPPNNLAAIPAVRGANNVAAMPVGSAEVLEGTDALQLVVPDPSTLVQTQAPSSRGTRLLHAPAMTCPAGMVYVSDHSAPSGAGKTQIIRISAATSPIALLDTLQFDVYPGSDVMCARVSSYWVDTKGWLHRSDLSPASGVVQLFGDEGAGGGGVFVSDTPVGVDVVSPGVADLQIAVRMSSEVSAIGRSAGSEDRWAFDGRGNPDPSQIQPLHWFEVRQVRASLLLKNLRAIEEPGPPITEPPVEDGTPTEIPRAYSRFRLTTGEVLVNLRFFDKSVPAGIVAEPF